MRNNKQTHARYLHFKGGMRRAGNQSIGTWKKGHCWGTLNWKLKRLKPRDEELERCCCCCWLHCQYQPTCLAGCWFDAGQSANQRMPHEDAVKRVGVSAMGNKNCINYSHILRNCRKTHGRIIFHSLLLHRLMPNDKCILRDIKIGISFLDRRDKSELILELFSSQFD